MSNMLRNTAARMPITQFRSHVSGGRLEKLLHDHAVVEVCRYHDTVNAVVVGPELFSELASAAEQLDDLRSALPLLIAAARSGVGIPSETLASLGFEPTDDSWQTLNAFQTQIPIRITRGADGETPARGPLRGRYVGEADLELDFID